MERRGLQQHLLSLLPSITLPLPAELINLGVSLLVQSRNKASSLKAEEEIARSYACAHIACERLKKKLDLPAISSKPPVPPRVYKKLYAHLDASLLPRPPNHAERRASAPVTPSKPRTTSAKTTPSRVTPSIDRVSKAPIAKRALETSSRDDLPHWAATAIRTLCASVQLPKALPHIFVGVSSILQHIEEQKTVKPALKRARMQHVPQQNAIAFSYSNHQLPALIALVSLHTFALFSNDDVSEILMQEQLALVVGALIQCVPDDGTWTLSELLSDTKIFIVVAEENGWLELEWYLNLEKQVDANKLLDDGEDEDQEEGGSVSTKEATSRKRCPVNGVKDANTSTRALGGMMTEQTNWLSEQKTEDFKAWLESIAPRLEMS